MGWILLYTRNLPSDPKNLALFPPPKKKKSKKTGSAASCQTSELSPHQKGSSAEESCPKQGPLCFPRGTLQPVPGRCGNIKVWPSLSQLGTTLAGQHNFRAPCGGQLWPSSKLDQHPTSPSARSCLFPFPSASVSPESPPNKFPHANFHFSACFLWKSSWDTSCIQMGETC